MPRKVCVVSGGRADYGLLRPVMAAVRDDPALVLQVVLTGTHLAPEFGSTWRTVDGDGFAIDARVDMLVAGDTPMAVAKSVGLGVIGFADALHALGPDLLLVLGDRFEILAATAAAVVHRIPIVHLCGGDLTEGAFDDSIRHAITKLAHIHCVTNGPAARRVRQMGENPARVFETGSPGLDAIRTFQPLERGAFFAEVGLPQRPRLMVVTYHPETLDLSDQVARFGEVLAALADLGDDVAILLTGSNADPDGRRLGELAAAFADGRDGAVFRSVLGQQLYLSALAHADAVVGNSSSGLYEAPSFGVPTVNIGDRQKGRLRAASVIDCPPERTAIREALARAMDLDGRGVTNPYGDGRSAERIVAAIKAAPPASQLLRKPFFEVTP